MNEKEAFLKRIKFFSFCDNMENIDVCRESKRQKWRIFYAQTCTLIKAAYTIKMGVIEDFISYETLK